MGWRGMSWELGGLERRGGDILLPVTVLQLHPLARADEDAVDLDDGGLGDHLEVGDASLVHLDRAHLAADLWLPLLSPSSIDGSRLVASEDRRVVGGGEDRQCLVPAADQHVVSWDQVADSFLDSVRVLVFRFTDFQLR